MFGFLVISHSIDIAMGSVELAENIADVDSGIKIHAVGGTHQGDLGVNPLEIRDAILKLHGMKGILIFTDLGSSILATEMILEDLQEEGYDVDHFHIANAPLVEGLSLACKKAGNYTSIVELKLYLENYYLPEYNQQFPALETTEQ